MPNSLLPLVQQQFGLHITPTDSPLVDTQPFRLPWTHQRLLNLSIARVHPTSNERTRCEAIVAPLLLGLVVEFQVSLFLGVSFVVNPSLGLVGTCDYLISGSSLRDGIHPPVSLIVEVKRDLQRALPHGLVELLAAQQFNSSAAPVYGVLTTGLAWQFLKLEGREVTIQQTVYSLDSLDLIAVTLAAVVGSLTDSLDQKHPESIVDP